jgi:threonylcarbamoyladenosine tRNA methylthiotransferase MtaB
MGEKNSKVAFLTLGCKVNQTESEALAQLLTEEGYQVVQETEEPEIIIINTCTVTGSGSSKSRKLIRKIVKDHPLSTVVIMGCYSQTKPEEVAELEGVDLILGTQNRRFIVEYLKRIDRHKNNTPKKLAFPENRVLLNTENKIERKKEPLLAVKAFGENIVYEELPLLESENRARAMLKIQDGCSQFCTYCIIPYARGPSRSRDPQNILAEAKQLLMAGYKELVLTGVHIGAYGKDLEEEIDLSTLVSLLVSLPGMNRLRLGSIEPMEFTTEFLEIVGGQQAICPHFHIPLQSASDNILAKMKRPYTTEDYALLLKEIRKRLPDAAIAADIMTGFPGETEKEHQEALDFIRNCDFAGIHVFPYSRREGTPAADMPNQVPRSVKAARVRDIIKIGKESRRRYLDRFLGKSLEVLIEKVEFDGTAQGHTRNYLELRLPPELNPGWQTGDLANCILRKEYLLD